MKLIKEVYQEVKYLTEENANGGKSLYIEGIYMQSDKENRNGRIYPFGIMEKEVSRYQQMIEQKRSLGELGHPPTPTLNLNNVSHLITSLRFEGKDVIGKAKILETPMGNIAKNFINEGVLLGVSSRGLGSLKELSNGINEVQDDFHLTTIDIVADPSAPDAFVQGIYESAEWVCENGIWREVQIEAAKKSLKKASSKNLEETKLKIFEQLMSSLSKI